MTKKPVLTKDEQVACALDDGKSIDAAYRRAVRQAVASNPKPASAATKRRAKARVA